MASGLSLNRFLAGVAITSIVYTLGPVVVEALLGVEVWGGFLASGFVLAIISIYLLVAEGNL